MVSLKRQSSNEPVVIEAGLDAEAPVERLFELLDFAAPGHAMRERGYLFLEEPEGTLGRYRVVDPANPDVICIYDVDLFDWPQRIRYETRFETTDCTSTVQRAISDYTLRATGPDTSHVRLTETVFLKTGLSRRDYRTEHAMLVLSVQRHITRLCMHAAFGAEEASKIG